VKLPNRTGTVYKLTGTRRRPWIARAYIGRDEYNIRKYETIGYFKTKTEATKALLAYNANPFDISRQKATLQQVFDILIEDKQKDLKPNSLKGNYIQPFNRFFSDLKDERFSKLRHHHFQKAIDERAEAGQKATYLNKVLVLVNQLYKTAILNDIATVDYSKGLKNRGVRSESQPYFTEEELKHIISQLSVKKDADVIATLCLTGLRPSELLNIRVSSVDLDLHIIRDVGIKTSAGKNKRVPIADVIFPYIEQRCLLAEDYLFTNGNSQMDYWHFLDYVYSPALERLGLKYRSPKACRHTFANITHGILDSKTRTEIIGHANESTTDDVYTDIEDKKLVDKFSKVTQSLTEV
jgi:integrase